MIHICDLRASEAVQKLVVEPDYSPGWNDEIGNAIRGVGMVMRQLD